MKKLLISGFDPFGGEKINPSFEAVKLLPDTIGEYELTKIELPTIFRRAAEIMTAKIEELRPDAVICVGQAGGRSGITPEVIGINLREAKIADNAGNMPQNEPVREGTTLTVTAPERENYHFFGWYIGQECVSTDHTYILGVLSDISLVARYAKYYDISASVNIDDIAEIST
jgi:hypothetical protein